MSATACASAATATGKNRVHGVVVANSTVVRATIMIRRIGFSLHFVNRFLLEKSLFAGRDSSDLISINHWIVAPATEHPRIQRAWTRSAQSQADAGRQIESGIFPTVSHRIDEASPRLIKK